MGSVRFTLLEADLVDAQKAWWTGAARWQRLLKTIGWLILVYGGIGLAIGWEEDGRARLAILGGATGLAVIVSLVLYALGWLMTPMRARGAFRQHRTLAGGFEATWDKDGILFTGERSTNRLPWSMLHQWLDGRRTLLLYHTSALFNPIPKRVLLPAQLVEIVTLMRAAGVPEAKRLGLFASKVADGPTSPETS